ncbi:MAG: tetratricopeptide repeat protein [Flavobacteriales bacterium]
MKFSIWLTFVFIAVSFSSNAQKFKRKQMEYDKMKDVVAKTCDTATLIVLSNALTELDNNQSDAAVELSFKSFKKNDDCPEAYQVYGWSLFRNGKWFDGVDVVEKGIKKFGPVPDLILRRGYMGLEMAELGVAQKNIDGNSVYSGGKNKLAYDEELFSKENFLTALTDFEYISNNYNDRYEEILIVGYIQQKLGEYQKSNETLAQLLVIDDYKDQAINLTVDNYMSLKEIDKAEDLLLGLEKDNPKSSAIQKKLYNLYVKKQDTEKQKIHEEKYYFYQLTPDFVDIEFNKDNYELLMFFADEEKKADDKLKKIEEIAKDKPTDFAIDVYLSILSMHANHGNGVEEKATENLANIGEPAIEKTIKLFQTNGISTCTVTALAEIMGKVKDPRGWQPLVDYLPTIATMPFTLIPPSVPAKILLFDKEKGTRVIVEFVLQFVREEKKDKPKDDSPFAELGGMFTQGTFYGPLEEIEKDYLRSVAKEVGYSEKEIEILVKKVYGDK